MPARPFISAGDDMKAIIAVLIVITVLLQYRLWFGDYSIVKVYKLRQTIAVQRQELEALQQRNKELLARIENIKSYPTAIEEQARYELGMVKDGEKYYQVLEPIE
jgi:cell division protein FtsB